MAMSARSVNTVGCRGRGPVEAVAGGWDAALHQLHLLRTRGKRWWPGVVVATLHDRQGGQKCARPGGTTGVAAPVVLATGYACRGRTATGTSMRPGSKPCFTLTVRPWSS